MGRPPETLIREIVASAPPLVGIRFGHQTAARALGGKAAKFAGGWSAGHQSHGRDGTTVHHNA